MWAMVTVLLGNFPDITGGTFVPTEASVSTLLAAETATPAALAAVGGVGTLALTVPARALMVVDLP